MKRVLLWCVFVGWALAAEAAEPKEFRLFKDVVRDAKGQESILSVVLDNDVYAATRPGFSDLRVFDAAGKEVPYLVEKVVETRERVARENCRSRVVSLREQDKGIELVVELEKNSPPADGLSIVTQLRDYQRRVQVFGSGDGDAWTLLLGDGLVFDYSRYIDVRNCEIRLPKNSYRQYKVGIADIVDTRELPFEELIRKHQGDKETERVEKTTLERRPFHIDRIETWREVRRRVSECEKVADYPVGELRVEEDADKKATLIELPTQRQPLTRLTLETASRNFVRSVEAQVPTVHGIQTEWDRIAEGQVSLLNFSAYHKDALDLSFSEQRRELYRIVIHNADNPPLKITGVKAQGNVYRVVFLAAANEDYRLCYGSAQVDSPSYDAAAVLAPLRQGHATSEARLGEEEANPVAGGTPMLTLRSIVGNPIVLGTIIVVLVAGLGWALYLATRRINALP